LNLSLGGDEIFKVFSSKKFFAIKKGTATLHPFLDVDSFRRG
jgi:hypothetical protein